MHYAYYFISDSDASVALNELVFRGNRNVTIAVQKKC